MMKSGEFLLDGLSRKRISLGFVLGLLSAASLYSWLCLLPDVLDFIVNYRWPFFSLNDASKNSYNLFIGLFSSVLGMGVSLNFWLNSRLVRGRKSRLQLATNDQRVPHWIFVWIFVHLGFLSFALLNGVFLYTKDLYYFFRTNQLLITLVIVTLFFQSWHKIIKSDMKRGWRWTGVAAMLVLVVGLSMSRINVTDYSKIEFILERSNPFKGYKLELPDYDHPKRLQKRSWVVRVDVVTPIAENNSQIDPAILIQYDKAKMSPIKDELSNFLKSFDPPIQNYIRCIVFMDVDVSPAFKDSVIREIFKSGIKTIVLGTNPPGVGRNDWSFYGDVLRARDWDK